MDKSLARFVLLYTRVNLAIVYENTPGDLLLAA